MLRPSCNTCPFRVLEETEFERDLEREHKWRRSGCLSSEIWPLCSCKRDGGLIGRPFPPSRWCQQTWSPGGDIRCLWITWDLQRPWSWLLKANVITEFNKWSQSYLWYLMNGYGSVPHDWQQWNQYLICGGTQRCQCPSDGWVRARDRAGTLAWEARRWCSLARLHTTPARRLVGALLRSPNGRKNRCFISSLCFLGGCLLYFRSPFLRWIVVCFFYCDGLVLTKTETFVTARKQSYKPSATRSLRFSVHA